MVKSICITFTQQTINICKITQFWRILVIKDNILNSNYCREKIRHYKISLKLLSNLTSKVYSEKYFMTIVLGFIMTTYFGNEEITLTGRQTKTSDIVNILKIIWKFPKRV